jgi:Holliday junction resolvase
MTCRSKVKGNTFERELVHRLLEYGLSDAERGYASDGRSLGLESDVDIKATLNDHVSFHIQAKRRKRLPKFLDLGSANIVAIREDRGSTKFLMDMEFFLLCLNTVRL